MTDESDTQDEAPPKKGLGKVVWLAVIAVALLGGGGAFYATFSGMLSLSGGEKAIAELHASSEGPTFVELDPLQLSVGGEGSIRQLRFRAFLQIDAHAADAIEGQRPRILDVFASYLRALPVATLQDPTALLQVRAQLLRRVQLLAGPDAVEDLLIIDFVIV